MQFTDESASMTLSGVSWKVAALGTNDGLTLIESGCGESAQIAMKLAIEQFVQKSKNEVYLFPGSWAIANGKALWSGIWQENDWKIENKDIWGQDIWQKMALTNISIFITHVCTSEEQLCSSQI